MTRSTLGRISCSTMVVAVGTLAPAAGAGSHLWQFWQVFSNDDGTIQYIELHVPVSANQEVFMADKKITSQSTGNVFTFPGNLQGPTGFKYLLIATADCAALPGCPTPDYIIPAGFFNAEGDTLKYHVYDTLIVSAPQMPTDCVMALNGSGVQVVNEPRNYAGQVGFIDGCAPECPGDLDGSGTVDGADLGALLAEWGTSDGLADLSGDGTVDGADIGAMLAAWGGCK